MDPPPLPLMVLNGLADDHESVSSLHGSSGLSLASETELIAAIRTLLHDGLIEAWQATGDRGRLVPAPRPATDDEGLRSYWFTWTADGERAWLNARGLLDAYDAE